jgi:pyrroloquinoline quinone (PQQ) biosynthesis protein C
LNNVYDEITNKAVSSLAELTKSPLYEAVCAMYAYELDLPNISRSMIEGLNKFFSLLNSNSTNYFEIHEDEDARQSSHITMHTGEMNVNDRKNTLESNDPRDKNSVELTDLAP